MNMIKRIRGTVIASKVSASFLNRMISKSREIFNDYIPDVWIYSVLVKNSQDHFYGITLHTNTLLLGENSYDTLNQEKVIPTPEEIAEKAC